MRFFKFQGHKMRSGYCSDISKDSIGKQVELVGWANSYRDHGGVIFIDLRDRSGIIQLVCDPSDSKDAHEVAAKVRDEYVLKARGKVRARSEDMINPKLKTGEIEVVVDELVIENAAAALPFVIGDESVGEETRLKYRFLDLRRAEAYDKFALRSKAAIAARNALDKLGFLEVETPILTRATPEGARDYLVPSRVHNGSFYALPQSPQLFKQLLMCAGFDKYFQIAKCFRDEDLRADRQPEFTQIDIEMSFCSQQDVMNVGEAVLKDIFKACGHDIATPFAVMPYSEAMEKYGSDKPDLRFDMPLIDVADIFASSNNAIFSDPLKDEKARKKNPDFIPNSETFLRHLCQEGLKAKGKTSKEYLDRLNYELKVINDMGFPDYFLIVWDIMKFCHDNDIPVGQWPSI